MKNLILISLLLSSLLTNGQEPIRNFKNHFKISPFALYDSENPSLRIEFERRVNEKIGFEIGAGWIYTLYDYKSRNLTESKNIGYIIDTQIRNYFSSYSNGIGYWGIRGVIIESDNTREMQFSPNSQIFGSPDSFNELVRFEKKIYGLQFILGGRFTVSNHIFLEGIIGLGTSYRYVNNNTPEFYPDPVFDRNIRAVISNRNYNNWFTPYPYFQIQLGYGW